MAFKFLLLKHRVLKHVTLPHLVLAVAISIFSNTALSQPPIQVNSCQRTLSFDSPPKRAISHDINLTEMMFALELQSSMVGYSGVDGWHKASKAFKQAAQHLPQLSPKAPSVEQLVQAKADFLFAGWNYGLKVGGPLTPAALKPFGITVYELTESCIHIMKKRPSDFEDVYQDLMNLGKIFQVENRAQKLIKQYKTQIKQLTSITQNISKPISVFLYDSGQDAPFTAGKYAIPTAMITAAGGHNIMDDLNSSWIRARWEDIVVRNPEFIVIVNYGKVTVEEKIQFLKQHPAMKHVAAVKNHRFAVLNYNEATPGVKSFNATEHLAHSFHPQLFKIDQNKKVDTLP